MKVITFSRNFPAKHPRKGQPTYFVEKIWEYIAVEGIEMEDEYYRKLPECDLAVSQLKTDTIWPKYHTIRRGNRWKVGDWFSPRVWSGKPYTSKQIQFAPPIQIKKIWNFEMDLNGVYSINGKYWMEDHEVEELARNDGLSVEDMMYWLMPNFDKPKEFRGQILCWGENIEYS